MKVIKFIDRYFEVIFISICLCLISVIMLVQIICRNFFSYAINWAEEICRYMFVWCNGIGISYATMKGTHLSLDIIPSLVPKLKKPLEVVSDIVLLALFIYILPAGMGIIAKMDASGQLSSALRLPIKYVYMAFEVGFSITIFRILEKYVKLAVHAAKGRRQA